MTNKHIKILLCLQVFLMAFACGRGKGIKKKAINGINVPKPTTKPDPNVGEEVPPVTSDTGTSVITGDKPELKHFVVQTRAGATPVEGRYKDEYLFVVHSTKKSCVRLTVRPGSTITPGTDVDKIPDVDTDYGACEAPAPEAPASAPAPAPAPGLRLKSDDQIQFTGKIDNLNLAAPSYALCSSRIFRMQTQLPNVPADPLGDTQNPAKVATKVATLVAKSTDAKVLVWADQEWLPPNNCIAGGNNGFNTGFSFPSSTTDFGIAHTFGPLWGPIGTGGYTGYYDVTMKTQFTNLAETTATSLSLLTDAFGAISDVDGSSGSINLFISPDVNRTHSQRMYNKVVDGQIYLPFYKPMDLASYNSTKNPTSNESETVYLWAPSPGGEYEYELYPSSNSLNSNYAYGFVGSQIMNLISDNQKLLKGVKEEPFLRESLSLLGSIYAAGSAFVWQAQSFYLASQSQFIPLSGNLDMKNFSESTKFEGINGQIGLRALYGWYLHSRLCDPASARPCLKIADLIKNDKTGKKNVEAVVGTEWAKLLTQFAASVSVGLVNDTDISHADIAKRFEDVNKVNGVSAPLLFKNELTLKPLPSTEVVSASNPVNLTTYTVDASVETPVISPYSGLKALLFQPILPDMALDFVIEEDSPTYILVTGIVSPETDITAYIGANTWVTVVPLGQRNIDKRVVYQEKLGEAAYLDLRPANLTDKEQAPTGANIRTTWELSPRVSEPGNVNHYTVTKDKELWLSGNISNTDIIVDSARKKVGDSDAYVLKLDPCNGPCATNEQYTVLIQTYIRPGSKNFLPMTLVGPTNKTAYHGATMWGHLGTIDPDYQAPQDEVVHYPVACQPGQLYSGNNSETDRCDNGGYNRELLGTGVTATPITGAATPSTPTLPTGRPAGTNFYDRVCNKSDSNQVLEDACWGGIYDAPGLFDSRNRMDFTKTNTNGTPATYDLTNYGFGIMGDNFLMSAYGYPFDNTHSIRFRDEENPSGPRAFTKEEANRMFFNFKFDRTLKANFMEFYTARSGFSVNGTTGGVAIADRELTWAPLDATVTSALLDAQFVIQNRGVIPAGDAFIETCTGTLTLPNATCTSGGSSTALFNGVKAYIERNKYYAVCRNTDITTCSAYPLFQIMKTSQAAPTATDSLISDQSRFLYTMRAKNPSTYATYYKPTYRTKALSGACFGNPLDDTAKLGWNNYDTVAFTNELLQRQYERQFPVVGCFGTSAERYDHIPISGVDIREQIHLPASLIGYNFEELEFPRQAQLFFDNYSLDGTEEVSKAGFVRSPTRACYKSPSDRLRDVRGVINFTQGEIIGMPRRFSINSFKIKGVAGPANSTYATLIVGGVNMTEGNYLVRVRVIKSGACETYPDGVRD
jgi:hypothetical protein